MSNEKPKSVCTCGHTGDGQNSEHAPNVAYGHGPCIAAGCTCEKFRWAGWLPEYAATLTKAVH